MRFVVEGFVFFCCLRVRACSKQGQPLLVVVLLGQKTYKQVEVGRSIWVEQGQVLEGVVGHKQAGVGEGMMALLVRLSLVLCTTCIRIDTQIFIQFKISK